MRRVKLPSPLPPSPHLALERLARSASSDGVQGQLEPRSRVTLRDKAIIAPIVSKPPELSRGLSRGLAEIEVPDPALFFLPYFFSRLSTFVLSHGFQGGFQVR